MTNPTQAGAAPPEAPPVYTYVGGTPELDQLLAMEDDLYTKSKAIEEQLDEVQKRIKVALTSITRPVRDEKTGQVVMQPWPRYRIALVGMAARRLSWKPSTRLDTPTFKAAHPDLYAAYSKTGGSWTMERER